MKTKGGGNREQTVSGFLLVENLMCLSQPIRTHAD